MWEKLGVVRFWQERLPQSREGTSWYRMLCDLTSTYSESDPPLHQDSSKRRFGYSRDHRPDCVQVIIALVVTPEGFPLALPMLDVHFPTTDGRGLVFSRYTKPEKDHQLLLDQVRWTLPAQPPPRIAAKGAVPLQYRPLTPTPRQFRL